MKRLLLNLLFISSFFVTEQLLASKKHYRNVLRRAGLRHVKIILRDESFFGYSAPLASLMVYAKKPLSTSKR